MTKSEGKDAVTTALDGFLAHLSILRERLAVEGPFDSVTLTAQSERWPREVDVAARNKLWELHFKCDSNEVCWLFLRDRTRRAPGARPKDGFYLAGLLKGHSIGPLCDSIVRIVQDLREFLQRPIQGDLAEAERVKVRAAFEQHTIALATPSLIPLSAFDEQLVTALAEQFMRENPDIFNHPRIEVRTIYRASEVRDWLAAQSDAPATEPLELKLLCYCVFKTVQRLCDHARWEDAYERSR